MKKFIILMATVILGMTSCVKTIEPIFNAGEDKLIAFESPVVNKATKASAQVISGVVYPTTSQFKVYAKYHDGDFVAWSTSTDYFTASGLAVSYSANVIEGRGGWHTTPHKYWPKTGKLSFSAYSPADAASASIDEHGVKFTSFTAAIGKDAQVDLLYSDRVVNQTANANVGVNLYGVQIPFKHALAQVQFTAKLKADSGIDAGAGDYVKIKSIVLSGIKTTGAFGQNLEDDTDGAGAPAWTGQATPATYANVVEDATYALTTTANSENFCPVLLMPQDFTDDCEVTIIYDLHINGVDEFDIPVTTKLNTLTYSGGNGAKFVMGKRYVYDIEFGLEKIYFAPVVNVYENISITGGINI